MKMRRLFWLASVLALAILTVACGGDSAPEEAAAIGRVDPDTGYQINPEDRPREEPFIVEGVIKSMSLIPNDRPEFLITGDNGQAYRFFSQPADQIEGPDGVILERSAIAIGMPATATLAYDSELNGDIGGYRATDLRVVTP